MSSARKPRGKGEIARWVRNPPARVLACALIIPEVSKRARVKFSFPIEIPRTMRFPATRRNATQRDQIIIGQINNILGNYLRRGGKRERVPFNNDCLRARKGFTKYNNTFLQTRANRAWSIELIYAARFQRITTSMRSMPRVRVTKSLLRTRSSRTYARRNERTLFRCFPHCILTKSDNNTRVCSMYLEKPARQLSRVARYYERVSRTIYDKLLLI